MRPLFFSSLLSLKAITTTLFPLLLVSPVQVLVSAADTEIAFINPPPAGERNDKKNAIYPIGSTMRLQWTEDQAVRSSLVLYQVPMEEGVGMGGFEYVAPNHIQLTDYIWTVVTTKNLSFSNVFQLALFSNGATSPDAMSHYFNITSSSSNSPNLSVGSLPSTSASSSAGSSTTALPTGSGTGTAGHTTATSSAGTDPAGLGAAGEEKEKKGLSTGAAIGIGIGVSAVIFLAIAGAFGFWIFKIRSKRNHPFGAGHAGEMPPPPHGQTPAMAHMGHGSPATAPGTGMVVSPDAGNGNGSLGGNMGNAGNGNTASVYQTKDIFGGELQGNGPHGVSVYEIDSQAGSPFAWDTRGRK